MLRVDPVGALALARDTAGFFLRSDFAAAVTFLRGAGFLAAVLFFLELSAMMIPPFYMISLKYFAASSGGVGLMYSPDPHSNPACLVRRGIISICQ